MKLWQGIVLAGGLLAAGNSMAVDIEGLWRTVDDRTGYNRGIIRITKTPAGTYEGRVVRILSRPGYKPLESCVKCPGEFKDQKILGMRFMWDLRDNPSLPNETVGGYILDPVGGKAYRARIKVNPGGKRLTMRGYIGVSALGRSQTWFRASEADCSADGGRCLP